MKRAWLFCSVACLLVAAVSVLLGHIDAAFVAAALGAVTWFLDLRQGLRKTIADSETKGEEEDSFIDGNDE